jgi:transposase
LPAAPLEDPRLAELVDRVHVVGVGTRARLLERETMLRLRMWAPP